MRLVTGHDQIVAEWVRRHIPNVVDWGPCTAIGVEDSQGNPVAGVVFHGYQPHLKAIEISCAAESSRWLTKKLASGIMSYAFSQLGCTRVAACTPSNRAASVWRFLTKFGFVHEGTLRLGLGDSDAAIWSMLASEWAQSPFNVARVSHGEEIFTPGPNARRSRRARQRAKRREHRDGAGTAAAEHDQHVGA